MEGTYHLPTQPRIGLQVTIHMAIPTTVPTAVPAVWLAAVLQNQIAIERFRKFVTLTTDRPCPNWQTYEIILPQSNFVTLHPGDSGQQADGLVFEHPIYKITSSIN